MSENLFPKTNIPASIPVLDRNILQSTGFFITKHNKAGSRLLYLYINH